MASSSKNNPKKSAAAASMSDDDDDDGVIAKAQAELARAMARGEDSAQSSSADDSDLERADPWSDAEEEEKSADFHGHRSSKEEPPKKKQRKAPRHKATPPASDDEQEEEDPQMAEDDAASVDYSADEDEDDKKKKKQTKKSTHSKSAPAKASKKPAASSSSSSAASTIKRQVVVSGDDAKTTADVVAPAKKFPSSCPRDTKLVLLPVTKGERFYRCGDHGPRFEVISLPESSTSSTMRCPAKKTEPGGKIVTKLMPDWAQASHKQHSFNARDTTKDIKDPTAYETFVLLINTFYAVSLSGGSIMVKNDVHGNVQALKDYRADAKAHRNIVPSACDVSPRGELTWLPWNIYYEMMKTTAPGQSSSSSSSAAAAAGAGTKRKSPAGGAAAAAHAALDVPALLLETATHWIKTDLEPRCRRFGGSTPAVYLDMLQTNYGKVWRSSEAMAKVDADEAAETEGAGAAGVEAAFGKLHKRACLAKDVGTDKPSQSTPAFIVGMQMRMFCLVHPTGKQLIVDLRAKFEAEELAAIKLARKAAGAGDDDDEC